MASSGELPTGSRTPRGAFTGVRLALSVFVGVIVAVLSWLAGAASYAGAFGWDATAITVLVWTWLTISPMGAKETEAHATREDPTRPTSDILLLAAAVASLAAVAFIIIQASSSKGSTRDVMAGVGVGTVALSWLLIHTVFTLRYAMLYYSGQPGGVDFNQSAPPRYHDFAYLAFTIGMTFQVSDTDLQTPVIRATALRQALLSFVFGTIIVATTVNLVAGLGSSSGGGR